jgi:hypothetical protein
MKKTFRGYPVPRHEVLMLRDGSFVVQMDKHTVRDLVTGQRRDHTPEPADYPLSDTQLEQLKLTQRIEHYDRAYVWVFPLHDPRPATQPRPKPSLADSLPPEKPEE